MSKHTEGEWRYNGDSDWPEVIGGDETIICEPMGLNETEWVANARLIAAAPDLLEACEQMAEIMTYYHTGEAQGHEDACENPDCCGHCKAMRLYRAAIAKARGA